MTDVSVRDSLKTFISRVSNGKGTDGEVAILPQVLDFYGTHFSTPEPAHAAAGNDTAPDDGFFPHGEVLVNAAQAAEFLGLNATHKFPNKAVLRLANEGRLHAPVRVGDKSPRWQAQWIRDYKARLLEESE